jgi:hypothetical protein
VAQGNHNVHVIKGISVFEIWEGLMDFVKHSVQRFGGISRNGLFMSVSKFSQCVTYLFDVRKQLPIPHHVQILRCVSQRFNVKTGCFQEALDLSRNGLPFNQPAYLTMPFGHYFKGRALFHNSLLIYPLSEKRA